MRKIYMFTIGTLLLSLSLKLNAQVDVTIRLDMSNQPDSGTPVWSGTINGFGGNGGNDSFTDLGNGIWELTLIGITEANKNGLIKYWNGSKEVFERGFAGTCNGFEAYHQGDGRTFRNLPVPATATTYEIMFSGCAKRTYENGAWDITPEEGDHITVKEALTISADMVISGASLAADVTVSNGATLSTSAKFRDVPAGTLTILEQDIEAVTMISELTSLAEASISTTESHDAGSKSIKVTRAAAGSTIRGDLLTFDLTQTGPHTFTYWVKSSTTGANHTTWVRRLNWSQSFNRGVIHGSDWTQFSTTVDVTQTGSWTLDITVPNEVGDYFYDDFQITTPASGGSGNVIIESGSSLITIGESDFSGDVTIKRNTTHSDGKYSFVGTPVESSVDNTGSDLGTWAYGYDETQAYAAIGGDRWTDAASVALIPGMGYAQAGQQEITFTGTPNDGDITVTGLTYTTGTAGEQGWNLLSNPYPASIEIGALITELTNAGIDGAVYLWDDGGSNTGSATNSDYITVSGAGSTSGGTNGANFNDHIGAMQGFFVKVAAEGSVDFTFTEALRASGNNGDANFFRKSNAEPIDIKLAIEANGQYNEVLVALREDATLGIDKLYDASKFITNANLELFSLINDRRYAIQALPIENGVSTELAYNFSEEGQAKLSVANLTGLEEGSTFLLKDNLTGQVYDLNKIQEIEFSAIKGADQNRFTLTYVSAKVLSDDLETSQPIYRYLDQTLFVNFGEALDVVEYSVYDLSGKVQLQNTSLLNGVDKLEIPFSAKGINIVKIVTSEGVFTRKFIY